MTAAPPLEPAGLSLVGKRVAVLGARGRTGRSMLLALDRLGAVAVPLDDADADADGSAAAGLPDGLALVLVTSGLRPTHPLVAEARARGIPVWGDAELGWRINEVLPEPAEWLVVTGTNGKTTTTEMLLSILRADGKRALACGNIGLAVLDAVLNDPPFEVLAVELSSFQLHWSPSVRPLAGAVLNLAPDHLDWHGSMDAYAAAKLGAFGDSATIAVGVDGATGSLELLAQAPGRRLVVTLGPPGPDQLGIVHEVGGPALLIDRAFAEGAPAHGEVLASLDQLPRISAAHELTNALAAAALARAAGVGAESVAEGLAAHSPGAHRRAFVATVNGVDFVNDSKATNPHAALVSVTAFTSVVWIAGGLNKDLTFDELVLGARDHLRAAVLIGRCAEEIAEAMARHAPQITVVRASTLEDGVREAAGLAHEGDTVLLAPAAASQDMFRDYGHRGDAFAAAVRELGH
jgi:UDP-N-acetylmuramoylalanine--D-glutamate ligase